MTDRREPDELRKGICQDCKTRFRGFTLEQSTSRLLRPLIRRSIRKPC